MVNPTSFASWHRLIRTHKEWKRKALVRSRLISNKFYRAATWWLYRCQPNFTVKPEADPVILMWEMSNRPRIHLGRNSMNTHVEKWKSKHTNLHGVKGRVWQVYTRCRRTVAKVRIQTHTVTDFSVFLTSLLGLAAQIMTHTRRTQAQGELCGSEGSWDRCQLNGPCQCDQCEDIRVPCGLLL